MSDTSSLLDDRSRRLSLLAILASTFAVGVAIGGLAPLLALTLNGRGVEPWLIGVNSAMSSVGLITASFFIPKIIMGLGPIRAFLIGLFIVFAAILLLMTAHSTALWFGIRFALGAGLALPWVVTETWMIRICREETRGRVMALYTTVLAAGFATGPIILTVVGTSGNAPFWAFALLFGVSALPILWVRGLVPLFQIPKKTSLIRLALVAPTIFLAALAAGLQDTTIFSLLPIYGLRLGFAEATAVLSLSCFLLGNLVLQYPIGWLADRFNARGALIGCLAVCALGPILSIFGYQNIYVLGVVFFIWGGASWSVYAIGLLMMGKRFRGGELAAANATFVVVFEFANVIGPPAAGAAMKGWDPHGLMVFLGGCALVLLVIAGVRGLRKQA